ncbi:hypothetical protein [Ornithinibacillus scapharcae]|uniref:hypothetical protein n=1 Tax=Ornithinibacillus scapharcae TaxID=1147159 RepID=UPI00110FBD72|nr:hypothetical protein [Ornithinibacillus scapharcae]
MMFQEINDQIVKMKADLHRKYKINLQLEDFEAELLGMENTIHQLRSQLEDEKGDVKKLEGFSITNFFSTITGTKYEKLDKEKQEVLAVQLQLEEAEKTRKEITSSIKDLTYQLEKLSGSEQAYKDLLATKEQWIKNSDSPYANRMYELSEQEGEAKAYLKEIEEAITAGDGAKRALENAKESLNSASNWGTLDMFGGGMLSSAIKHSKMDDASNYIHIAQQRMRSFQKELLDINEMIQVDMDMSGLLKFADFFFDGIIVDWMVQGRINNSMNQVEEQLSQVWDILTKLKAEQSNLQNKIIELGKERENLLETL